MKALLMALIGCVMWSNALATTCVTKDNGDVVCGSVTISYDNGRYFVTQEDDNGEKEVKSYRCRTYGKVVKCVER